MADGVWAIVLHPAIPPVTSQRDVDGASPRHITVRSLACDPNQVTTTQTGRLGARLPRLHTHRQTRTASPVGELCGDGYSRCIPQSHAPSDLLGESASPCWNGALMGEHEGPSEQELHAQPSCALLACEVPTLLPRAAWAVGTSRHRHLACDRSSCPPSRGPSAVQYTARWMARGGRCPDGFSLCSESPRYLGFVLPRNPTRATLLRDAPSHLLQSPTAHPDRSTGTSEGIHALTLVTAPLGAALLFP